MKNKYKFNITFTDEKRPNYKLNILLKKRRVPNVICSGDRTSFPNRSLCGSVKGIVERVEHFVGNPRALEALRIRIREKKPHSAVYVNGSIPSEEEFKNLAEWIIQENCMDVYDRYGYRVDSHVWDSVEEASLLFCGHTDNYTDNWRVGTLKLFPFFVWNGYGWEREEIPKPLLNNYEVSKMWFRDIESKTRDAIDAYLGLDSLREKTKE